MNPKNFFQWGLVLIAIYAIYKLLQKFNILDDSEDKGAEQVVQSDLFTPQQGSKLISELEKKLGRKVTATDVKNYSLPSTVMLRLSNDIIKAKGFLNDNEVLVFTVFKNFKSKFQVYYFSEFFKSYQKKDLISFLSDFLDTSELNTINNIINKLPNF